MSAKHTPGPWHVNTAGMAAKGEPFKITEIYVYAPYTQDDVAVCADVIDPVTQEPSEANACLIAAAPDLLEALKEAMSELWSDRHSHCTETEFQKEFSVQFAAIAKATGAAA